MGLNIHHIHILLSFPECKKEPFCSPGLTVLPSGYFPQHEIIANFNKNGKTAAFCDSDLTLRGTGSVFTLRQLHPAGCVVGAPSVVWELCLQATTLPKEKG